MAISLSPSLTTPCSPHASLMAISLSPSLTAPCSSHASLMPISPSENKPKIQGQKVLQEPKMQSARWILNFDEGMALGWIPKMKKPFWFFILLLPLETKINTKKPNI